MPVIPILNSQDRKEFDSVPVFDSYQRKQFFRVTSQIQDILGKLRTSTTKVAFLLVLGYFKATKQFFNFGFHSQDVQYVCTRLGINMAKVDLKTYSRQKFAHHKGIIIELTGWKSFDEIVIKELKLEIQFMLRSQTRHKAIFEVLVDKLILKKIEIPSYNLLANLIDQECRNYDEKIDQILVSTLGDNVISELNELLHRNQSSGESDKSFDNTPYILTTLKRFNQSNRPGKIQKNLVALSSLKSLFNKLEPARSQIDFTNEGIKYYASLTIKQELFQLSRRNENERLIYFYCFIVSQYQKLQDLLVDTIYYTVYSYQNQAKKAMEASYLETKSDNDKFFELVKVSRKKQAASYVSMKKIIQDQSLRAELKIQQLTLLITEAEKSLPDPELIKTLETVKNMDENYFLEVQARKIIIRLSSIIQELDFDRDPQSNDRDILQAIDYYKANKGEVRDKAPTGFLSKMDFKAVKCKVNNSRVKEDMDSVISNDNLHSNSSKNPSNKPEHPSLRKALYKVFLFKEISKHLKAGSLNLKHSFRYKSAEESLIGATDFEQNMDNYLSLASQTNNKDGKAVLATIEQKVDFAYNNTNCNILGGRNELIKFDTSKEGNSKEGEVKSKGLTSGATVVPNTIHNISTKFTILTPKIEESGTKLSDLLPKDKYIDLTEILHTVANMSGYCQLFENLQNNPSRPKPSKDTILASIFALGCNLGLHKVSQITGIKESELEYTNNWYLTMGNLKLANEKVVELITRLDLPNIYRLGQSLGKPKLKQNGLNQNLEKPEPNSNLENSETSPYQNKLFTSSDGQKVVNNKDSFNSNYSYKFGGKTKASSNYTHIDMRHILFHSTVISASEREAVYVIDGLLHSKWIQSDIHATDSFGATEVVFGLCYLLGFELVPRLKEVHAHTLYSFKSRREYEAVKVKVEKEGGKTETQKYKILPKQTIKKDLILDEWNNLLRLACSIKLGICSGSQILKRLNSYSKKNKLYLALRELGRIIKTNMILTYIDDTELRQMIQKQLNIVEHSNRFSKAVRFGNGGEMLKVEKEDQDIAESCKRLQENSIILHNYLYLTRLLQNEPDQTKRQEMFEIISRGSPICWSHINFYGEYNFSEQNNPDSYDLNLSQINTFKLADFWEGQKPQNTDGN